MFCFPSKIRCFLIDSFLINDKIFCYFIKENGEKFYLFSEFLPFFYISKKVSFLEKYIEKVEEKFDVIRRKNIKVYKVRVPLRYYSSILKKVKAKYPDNIYNVDLNPVMQFYFENNIYPLAEVEIKAENGYLKHIESISDRYEIDYNYPPLSYLTIKPICDGNPKFSKWREIEVTTIDKSFYFDALDENFLEEIKNLIEKYDPDIILTEAGDPLIIPFLDKNGINLSRPFLKRVIYQPERTYTSYGSVVFRDKISYLIGRIHIDLRNSFFGKEAGFEGIAEVSRMTSAPLQECARFSPGSAISNMELRIAYENNYLIPYQKAYPENFKSALELLEIDKGGIIFYPEPGVYKNVAEFDFFSMYPSIILKYNISIETFNCKCCKNSEKKIKIPGTNYYFCSKRKGLIPKTIEPILIQREKLKERGYKYRQLALKWMLVTCFGYLGYKNAKFGCVEAHESTTAMARELMLKAKEVVEGEGFKFIHGIVDSIWCYKENASEKDFLKLREKIERITGFKIKLEGIYKFIKFLPSRDGLSSVPNKFFGVFKNGEIKARGIMLRRKDVPDFIKDFQLECIENIEKCDEVFLKYLTLLKENLIPMERLTIRRRLSKNLDEYKVKNIGYYLKKKFSNANIGEIVSFVVVNDNSPILEERVKIVEEAEEFDFEYYKKLLEKAYEEIKID